MIRRIVICGLFLFAAMHAADKKKADTEEHKWKPGYYKDIPGTDKKQLTLKYYLPKIYDGITPLPVLWWMHPQGNKDLDYRAWAEKRGVILIGIDASKNGPNMTKENRECHVDAMKTVKASGLCIDYNMMMAAGMSGAGSSAWDLTDQNKKQFVGLLLMGCYTYSILPKHISVAFIRGENERVRDLIEKSVKEQTANGNEIIQHIIPGAGHVAGPKEMQVKCLDWLFDIALKRRAKEFLDKDDLAKAGIYYRLAAMGNIEGAQEQYDTLYAPLKKYNEHAKGLMEKHEYYKAYQLHERIIAKYGLFARESHKSLKALKTTYKDEVKASAILERARYFYKHKDINTFKRYLAGLMKQYPDSKAAVIAKETWKKKSKTK